ncbi:hypothetical protein Tco_1243053 [Tanacetum coccineum]
MGLSQATHQELQTHRDHVYAHETYLQAHQTQLQLQSTLIQTQHQVHETRFQMQHAELSTLVRSLLVKGRQDQMVEALRVIRDMRREMSDMQTELLALREPQRRARQPGPEARIPDHQEASGDADNKSLAPTTRRGQITSATTPTQTTMTPESIQHDRPSSLRNTPMGMKPQGEKAWSVLITLRIEKMIQSQKSVVVPLENQADEFIPETNTRSPQSTLKRQNVPPNSTTWGQRKESIGGSMTNVQQVAHLPHNGRAPRGATSATR